MELFRELSLGEIPQMDVAYIVPVDFEVTEMADVEPAHKEHHHKEHHGKRDHENRPAHPHHHMSIIDRISHFFHMIFEKLS